MKNKSHKAFSLTELIIVLVIIALLFAAMAPIITKRHIAEAGTMEAIWNFLNNDTERNSYFDPGAPEWTSSIYVGMNPRINYNDSGKLVINSKNITYKGVTYPQPQLQFRFSPNNDELSNGIDAGSLLIDGGGNVYFGQVRNSIGDNNTVLGFSALDEMQSANGLVAVGTGALQSANVVYANGENYHITAVGANAGSKLNKNYNGNGIFVGAGSGAGYSASNIGIGYHAIYSAENSRAENNIAVGVNNGLFLGQNNDYINNILINSKSTSEGSMSYNTIIGFNSYNNGKLSVPSSDSHLRFLTSVGPNACSSIGADKGMNTCIGVGSGSAVNGAPEYKSSNNDFDEHIFLGGVPKGFNGRGVMEVHTYRTGGANSVIGTPGSTDMHASNVDVVLNSNLVVRGKLYTSDNGSIANYKFVNSYEAGLEPVYYRCASDTYRSVLLSYNVYLCTDNFLNEDISKASPRTINIMQKDGTLPSSSNIINSDERLKTDIVVSNAGLDKLLLLEPYNYTFKSDSLALPQVGVIAQDLQKIFPESVSTDEKGFLKIRWDEMFYSVINSIKELSQKVEKISEKLAKITAEISNIKSQQKNIRKRLSSLDGRIKRLERK